MLDKLSAITRIIEKIKRFPVTFESMRDWIRYENIEISDRTLYRYLEEIKNLPLNDGRIITIDGDYNKKTWKFEYDKSAHEFGESDIKSFLLLKNLAPCALTQKRQGSIEKIEEVLFKAQSKSKFEYHMQSMPQAQIKTSSFNEYVYSETEQHNLDTLIWAMQHSRKLKIMQVDVNTKTTNSQMKLPVIMMPMQILYHNGSIYILLLIESSLELMIYDLSAIKQFDILENIFSIQKYMDHFYAEANKRFGVAPNFDHELYEIKLEFNNSAGSYISNRFWHCTQRFGQMSSGKWEMCMNLGINAELVDWIFGWGNQVKVLGPELLQQKLKEKLVTMMDTYLNLTQ
ncbi:Predicted DNA-binding transcriptional regulator YafY, contains an HTH and WYL domains [Arachidicoccus rhizosphaerae]|uniref:Predicted DNA-binding transcriptional regulator YafY, contains an HTH and WYL domains n=1 Tax=Arachidicoccus rhizosphaerae TaxID=551991 RepID=A0A1H3Y3Q1_9BACT|nr:WYL domain-containing protein [Arachidicoccus rhizosphaerae]SEA06345.1 Predicted DNA-binding transcriptional regulator YafY, contains an HTH and WYL domains [Arachidicoccus rhizosphaerae]